LKLLFDQNLSYKLVRSFSDEFPGSAHVRDLGLASVVDIDVWEYAKQFGFTIVSKDTDFSQRGFLFGPLPKLSGYDLETAHQKRSRTFFFPTLQRFDNLD
jgi:predicted nuclease of predicted toxin-antitoxin system